jgi:hypothetical protein
MTTTVDLLTIALFRCECGGPSVAFVLGMNTEEPAEVRTYDTVCLKCKKMTMQAGEEMVKRWSVEWML